jgi:hypothetical protein
MRKEGRQQMNGTASRSMFSFSSISIRFGKQKVMPKTHSNWEAVAIGILSILLGLVAFVFSQSIFNLFFVSIVVAVLWNYTDKTNKLERRISEIEARLPK